MQSIDVIRARKETPASASIIHFNNAGSSLTPLPVQQVVTSYQQIEYNLGGYETFDKHLSQINDVYGKIAALIGADAEEIAITTSASHSYGLALQSLKLKSGDKVLCCHAEYISNYMGLLLQQRQGIEVVVVPDDEHGQIDLVALEKAIDSNTKLISLTHIPTSGGLINPAEEVGKIARRHGILYILDACQSVGQIKVDVSKIGCDMLAATGRKYLRGPRGTGFLYVKKDLLPRMEPPIVDGWGGEWTTMNDFQYRPGRKRMELYEKNFADVLGLGEAASYANSWGMENVEARNIYLGKTLRDQLAGIKNVKVRDKGLRLGGIVTFTMDGKDHGKVHQELRAQNIHLSISLGAGARLDLGQRGIESVLRASVHYYNTEEEIKILTTVLGKL
ncbi:MAG: aminotransferase class V-fold PLP-dependent enzyme [Cyclobacteriaceae bacterium]|nr:aminotransferase class V-fold PLP-dependent enzyme [Cyclobacteriaceae bacterium]